MTTRVDDLITLLRTYPPDRLVYMDTQSNGQHISIKSMYVDGHGRLRISSRDERDPRDSDYEDADND